MKEETVGRLLEKIKVLFDTEIAEKLRRMKIDETKDRIRIIFEFEFDTIPAHQMTPMIRKKVIRDAVEIRHRRPWK